MKKINEEKTRNTASLFGLRYEDVCKVVPQQLTDANVDARAVQDYLQEQNTLYIKTGIDSGDISADKRLDTATHGQHPYAIIVTCSDSRVPAEHIFNAGIGELFVIRAAGNVIGDFELGSIEYGAEHLGVKLVVVMGHTNCGAVDAALHGGAHGFIRLITDEISASLTPDCDPREAERLNVRHSMERILQSEIMRELVDEGQTKIVGAIYDIEKGEVCFLD